MGGSILSILGWVAAGIVAFCALSVVVFLVTERGRIRRGGGTPAAALEEERILFTQKALLSSFMLQKVIRSKLRAGIIENSEELMREKRYDAVADFFDFTDAFASDRDIQKSLSLAATELPQGLGFQFVGTVNGQRVLLTGVGERKSQDLVILAVLRGEVLPWKRWVAAARAGEIPECAPVAEALERMQRSPLMRLDRFLAKLSGRGPKA